MVQFLVGHAAKAGLAKPSAIASDHNSHLFIGLPPWPPAVYAVAGGRRPRYGFRPRARQRRGEEERLRRKFSSADTATASAVAARRREAASQDAARRRSPVASVVAGDASAASATVGLRPGITVVAVTTS